MTDPAFEVIEDDLPPLFDSDTIVTPPEALEGAVVEGTPTPKKGRKKKNAVEGELPKVLKPKKPTAVHKEVTVETFNVTGELFSGENFQLTVSTVAGNIYEFSDPDLAYKFLYRRAYNGEAVSPFAVRVTDVLRNLKYGRAARTALKVLDKRVQNMTRSKLSQIGDVLSPLSELSLVMVNSEDREPSFPDIHLSDFLDSLREKADSIIASEEVENDPRIIELRKWVHQEIETLLVTDQFAGAAFGQ